MLKKKSFLLSFFGFSTSIPPCLRSTFVFCFFLSFPLSLPIPWAYPPSHTHTHHLHFYIPGLLLLLQGRPLKSSSPATIWNRGRILLSGPPCTFIAFCFLHFPIWNTLFSVVFFSDAFSSFYFILFFCYQRHPKRDFFIFVFFPSRLLLINLFHLGYRPPLQTHRPDAKRWSSSLTLNCD